MLLAACARGEVPAGRAAGAGPVDGRACRFRSGADARLDPDGAEPDDGPRARNRALRIGALRGGVHPVSGGLLPVVAAQFQRLFDALNNPSAAGSPSLSPVDTSGSVAASGNVAFPAHDAAGVAEAGPGLPVAPDEVDGLPAPEDCRTPAQRNHDNLAMILGVAAASGGMPELGGAAPTLVVSVTAEDYASGLGRAFLEGTGDDVPLTVAHHTACAGGIQRVLFDQHGQVVAIGTTGRIFTALQRRAIVLRDRECLIPGCHTPATGASSTMSASGPTADRRTPATASRSAGTTTALLTLRDGRSA